jgi:hypothetical protein
MAIANVAQAGPFWLFTDASGLSAKAEFTLLNATTLEIKLQNTSTGVPLGFSNSDQLLTSISFDLGAAGNNAADPDITGGSVILGPSSVSLNFDDVVSQLGPGDTATGEYGYGNGGTTGLKPNFLSGNTAGATAFGGTNLDGPANINGPQAGLVAASIPVDLGGLGAIKDQIIATLTLDKDVTDLSFLDHGVVIEFGSDAAFLTGRLVPEPSTLALALVGGLGLLLRVRRRVK